MNKINIINSVRNPYEPGYQKTLDKIGHIINVDFLTILIKIAERRNRRSKFCLPDDINIELNRELSNINIFESGAVNRIENFDILNIDHLLKYPNVPNDGTLIGHYFEQTQITKRCGLIDLKNGAINPAEFKTLCILSRIHDLGEIIKGDYCKTKDNFESKDEISEQKNDEQIEQLEGKKIIKELIKDIKLQENIINIYDILFNAQNEQQKKLQNIFSIYEKIGYLNTGLKTIEAYSYNEKIILKPLDLFYYVFANQIGILTQNKNIPSVEKFLSNNIDEINKAIGIIFIKQFLPKVDEPSELIKIQDRFENSIELRSEFLKQVRQD